MDSTQASPEARLHFLDYWRVIRTRKVIVFVVFLLVVLVTAVITYFQPKIYMSATRIQVEQERPSVAIFTPQQAVNYDPYFLQTQYEIIQSQKILYPVIERMGLQKRWSGSAQPLPMEVAFKRLKSALAVRRYRDTSLIEIAVQHEDPQLAADIANTIAEVFERDRLEVKRQQTSKGLDKLREDIIQQEARVQEAQQKVEQLRKDLDVPVVGGSAANETMLSDQTLQQLETRLTEARVEAGGQQTRLEELNKLSHEQLRNAIGTIVNDTNFQGLLQNLTQTELALETLKEDYGPDHPTVRTAMAQHDKLQEQLDARVDGIMRSFEVQYHMAQSHVEELQRQLNALKATSLALASDKYLPFRNAQREEDFETSLCQTLKARLQQTSIEMEVPRSPVEVVDRAEPSLVPVRPNMWMNVSIGAVVGLLLGVALTFFIEFLDTSVKRMEDVERDLGLPVLGVIAQSAGLLGQDDVSPSHVEAYRMLRTNLEFAKGGAIKSLCVLSAGAGEGKSFTIANLAYVFAQHGARVLVVDSDLRRPGVHLYLGVNNELGLAEYLSGQKTVDQVVQPTRIPNVSIIASGGGGKAKSALPMLTSQRMEQLIREVGAKFDIVLYDTPPVLGVSDAAVVAREVGTSVLVIQHRRYPRAMSLRSRQVIENAGGKLLGVVVNNVNVGQDETYYYYHDHYEEYLHGAEGRPKPVSAEKKPDSDEIELQGKY